MKLIKLSDTHYVITDDVQIEKGDYALHNNQEYREKYNEKPICCTESNKDSIQEHWDKITHSTEPIEEMMILHGSRAGHRFKVFAEIKQLNLSEVQELIYGYSVEQMAEKYFLQEYSWTGVNNLPYKESDVKQIKNDYIKGFKAHQELVKDKNREVVELLTNITEWSSFKDHPIGKQAQRALDLLLPKTEWSVEFDEQGKLKLV